MTHALERAKADGARSASLEVRASNLGAQALYAGFGFEVVGKRKAYYHDNREDALLMYLPSLEGVDRLTN